ncbi:MAG TPA: hypothetical protein VFX89_10875 [Gammaproteobacteria bacterium]|nr:hypothetical protein [Gammaproteobacteria bacterium]
MIALAGALIVALASRLGVWGRVPAAARQRASTASVASPAARADAAARDQSAASGPPGGVADRADATSASAQDFHGEPPPLEQRAAAVIAKMAARLELHGDNVYADGLVRSGLSRIDSEAMVARFYADVAKCAFEDARGRAEIQGTPYGQYLAVAELVWSSAPEDTDITVASVALLAMPCVADAAQRAAIALPPDLMARYAALEAGAGATRPEDPPDPLPPQWARAMEAAIRAHVARYPAVVLTSLDARCNARGCSVVLEGDDVPVYDLELDVFAEQNGFQHASVNGRDGRRVIWLPR